MDLRVTSYALKWLGSGEQLLFPRKKNMCLICFLTQIYWAIEVQSC